MSMGSSVTPFPSVARCFVTRDLPGGGVARLRERHEVDLWDGDGPPPREALLAGVAEADGVLALLTDPIDAELIAAAPKLAVISNYAVGVDNVDVGAATARGVPVGHTPDVLTDSTADLAVALMLAVSRRLAEGERIVRGAAGAPGTPPRFSAAICTARRSRSSARDGSARPC